MWKLEGEAMEAVKFLWKRKHFDERDWKRKGARKRLILSELEAEAKNSKYEEAKANSEAFNF